MPFTPKQRQWILERDGKRCMFHWKVNGKWVRCENTKNLEVHHIIPSVWVEVNLPDWDHDRPTNAVTLCREHHRMGKVCVHPSHFKAQQMYRKDNDSFGKAQKQAREFSERGEPYWESIWDWMWFKIARKQTAKFSPKNPWPISNGKK